MKLACLYPMELEKQGSKVKMVSLFIFGCSMGSKETIRLGSNVGLFYILLRIHHCHLHKTGMSLSNGIKGTRVKSEKFPFSLFIWLFHGIKRDNSSRIKCRVILHFIAHLPLPFACRYHAYIQWNKQYKGSFCIFYRLNSYSMGSNQTTCIHA